MTCLIFASFTIIYAPLAGDSEIFWATSTNDTESWRGAGVSGSGETLYWISSLHTAHCKPFFRKSSKKFGTYCLPAQVVPVCTKLPFCQIHCKNQQKPCEIIIVGDPLSICNEKYYCIGQSGSLRKLASGLRLSTAWHSRCIAQKKMSLGSTSRRVCPCVYVKYYCFIQEQWRYIVQCSSNRTALDWKHLVSLVQIKDTLKSPLSCLQTVGAAMREIAGKPA